MIIKVKHPTINNKSIFNQLIFDVEISFHHNSDYPIQVNGVLSTVIDSIEIATLVEYKNDSRDIPLNCLSDSMQKEYSNTYQNKTASFRLLADLSPKAIEHIENVREKSTPNDINFRLELQIKFISIEYNCSRHYTGEKYDIPFIKYHICSEQKEYNIKQSDWVAKYAEKLGIGKFLLLEMDIPEKEKFDHSKSYQIFKSSLDVIKEVEEFIHKGDWKPAMTPLRQFFENFKNDELRAEINDLLEKDGHNEEGIKNFFSGTNSLFHFLAKYLHILDTKNQNKTIPLANKEEVYLGYSIAIGIMNLIGKKLAKKSENT